MPNDHGPRPPGAQENGRPRITTAGSPDSLLRIEGITKLFGTFRAVDRLSLDIRHGEVFALLGPSGCGKSTTLRQIAGLDQPDEGRITLKDEVLFSFEDGTFVPTQQRNMGMVFQNYAIWPHLTVAETIAYPLRVRRRSEAEIAERVHDMLRQVGLEGFAERPSTMLSGGQQQRVALARALVYKPDVLLLDEPFSNLDVKLREQMRIELKLLQREVGVTVILVTHDQAEALSLSDRIAVMNEGRIEQVGTPIDLYAEPATPFVRDFIGLTARLPARVKGTEGDGARVLLGDGSLEMVSARSRLEKTAPGAQVVACIRPESIRLGSAVEAGEGNVAEGVITALFYLGDHFECVVSVAGETILVLAPRAERLGEGDRVALQFPKDELTLWPR